MSLFGDEDVAAPGDEPRRPWTSPSRLATWQQCPRRYDFQHVRKLPTKPSPHLDLGSNVHAALRDWLRLPPAQRTWDGLLGFYRAAWSTNRPAFRTRSREELREWGERGIAMLRRFVERTPAGLEPLAIEKWVGIPLGEIDVRGKVDRVDEMPGGRLRVVDYKTGRFPRDPARVREEDLAAAVYAGGASAAFAGMPVGAVEYLYLDTMESLEFPVGADWQARKEQAIGALAREARDGEARGAFPPRPSRLCAWCDFRERCPEGQAFLDDRGARR